LPVTPAKLSLNRRWVVRHPVKGLHHVKEEDRQPLPPGEMKVPLPKQLVDVVVGGEMAPKASLVRRKEFLGFEKVRDSVVPDALKHAHDHAGDTYYAQCA